MGLCSSCCRRRHKEPKDDPERQPLLRSDSSALKDASTPYEKIADVLAALHAGKLPSQQQLDKALRTLLKTGLLDADAGSKGGALNEAGVKVVNDTREVVEALIRFGMEKNGDNRLQDLAYQVERLSTLPVEVEKPIQVRVSDGLKKKADVAASAIPSQEEVASDTAALLSSIKTLSKIVITSSAFRAILADLLLTARETVAASVEQVRKAAETVEKVAETVEKTLKPELESNFANREGAIEQPMIQERTPKEVALDRLEEIFMQAQASPQYNSALRVMLYIFQKYAARVSVIASTLSEAADDASTVPTVNVVAPVIVPDPRFRQALEDVKIIIERLAGGKSVDVPLQSLFHAIKRVYFVPSGDKTNDVQLYFQKVGKWLDNALADPMYVSSRRGREAASVLFDEGHAILALDTNLQNLLHRFLGDVQDIVDAIKKDIATRTLLNSLDKLKLDIVEFSGRAALKGRDTAVHWRVALARAILGWVLPRVLHAIRVLPMPRVEFISQESTGSRLAVAIDALLMTAQESLLPDVLTVQEFAEVRVEMDEGLGSAELTSPNSRLLNARRDLEEGTLQESILEHGQNGYGTSGHNHTQRTEVKSTSRMRLHVEGLRVAAHDVGYFASYSKNSWLGYEDEGLLSVDIGRGLKRGEGLSLDVELEVDTDSAAGNGAAEGKQLFHVLDVTSSLPGLSLRLSRSKHWIVNNLIVSPFAGPLGRLIVPKILDSQVRNALSALEKLLRDAKQRASETAMRRDKDAESSPNLSDWFNAVLEGFSNPKDGDDSSENGEDDGEEDVPMATETEMGATLSGIYRTVVTKPDPELPPSMNIDGVTTTESTLAVGLGAQLLPGKAEQAVMEVERESPSEAAHDVSTSARRAIDDIKQKATNAASEAHDTVVRSIEGAVESRQVAEQGVERIRKQEANERRRRGWRSNAFDY